jgi:glycerol-3-phosphate dehydrogenase (NAD(P)+)
MLRKRENVRFLPGVPLPEGLRFTSDFEEAVLGATLVVTAIPTQHLRSVLVRYSPFHPRKVPLCSVSKGLEIASLKRNTEVIREILGPVSVGVLSGPSHAEEVARGLPASVVAASSSPPLARRIQKTFNTDTFRVYHNNDPIGVELGGALKNVIALAAGICDGMELGDNAKSALITRGLVEIARLGKTLGGRQETFFGLSGLGDLITTCASRHSRNRRVGEALGRGEKLSAILEKMQQVAEGVPTTRAVHRMARTKKVEMPIASQVYRICFHDKDPRQALKSLLRRPLRGE